MRYFTVGWLDVWHYVVLLFIGNWRARVNSTFQVLFFRGLIGLAIVTVLIMATKDFTLFTTKRFKLHAVRNSIHLIGQYGWFVGIALLPLAQVFALEFTVPLWTALIAAMFLGERLTGKKALSIVLGLIGVVIIVKPSTDAVDTASLIVLGVAVCYAVSHVATNSLASTEHPLTILFMMCVMQLPVVFLFSLDNWLWPTSIEWLWLSLIGVTALSAHFCLAKAMATTEVTLVMIMDFLRLPAIGVVGVLFYHEAFELSLIVGALTMLLGNVWALSNKNMSGSS